MPNCTPRTTSHCAAALTRAVRIARVSLALAVTGWTCIASAQSSPWIGLTGSGALLLQEGRGPGSGEPAAYDQFGQSASAADFNNDGFDDLAIGIPRDNCGQAIRCGGAHVRYGQADGALGEMVKLDPASGPAGAPAFGSEYGYGTSLAAGDFNGDGYADLVAGDPDFEREQNAGGAVHVHYGRSQSSGSLPVSPQHIISAATPGIPEDGEIGDAFGRALAVGDFNGDEIDDLAIGAPGDDGGEGRIVVDLGKSDGLLPFFGKSYALGAEGLPDEPERGDEFGYALAAGNFNRDEYDDLAIGIPGANGATGESGVGKVLVLYGSADSLTSANHWYFGQVDLNQTFNFHGEFGAALVTGDFDGDGFDDLAIGSPRYDFTPETRDQGLVAVVYGGASGLSTDGFNYLFEHLPDTGGSPEEFDRFGEALAAGEFNGDGIDDLVIGIPGDNGLGDADSGAAVVVLGGADRDLGNAPSRQLRPGCIEQCLIPDKYDDSATYGASLATGDFDGNGLDDLVIGAPGRDDTSEATVQSAGAAAVIFSATIGIFANGFDGGVVRLRGHAAANGQQP